MNTYFGYIGHVWLHKPKMIASTCRRLWFLCVCHDKNSSFTSFLRYHILRNPAIWLAHSILAHKLRTRILQDMGLVMKNKKNISFHFRLIPTNNKILQKIQKNPIFGPFWALFAQKKRKKRDLSVFKYSNDQPWENEKNEKKKLMGHSWEKYWIDWQMNRETDRETDRRTSPKNRIVNILKLQKGLSWWQNKS